MGNNNLLGKAEKMQTDPRMDPHPIQAEAILLFPLGWQNKGSTSSNKVRYLVNYTKSQSTMQTPTWVYLNCCSTSLITVWQSRQMKVPLTNSGCTGWVLTTCPLIRSNVPIFWLVSSRILCYNQAMQKCVIKIGHCWQNLHWDFDPMSDQKGFFPNNVNMFSSIKVRSKWKRFNHEILFDWIPNSHS